MLSHWISDDREKAYWVFCACLISQRNELAIRSLFRSHLVFYSSLKIQGSSQHSNIKSCKMIILCHSPNVDIQEISFAHGCSFVIKMSVVELHLVKPHRGSVAPSCCRSLRRRGGFACKSITTGFNQPLGVQTLLGQFPCQFPHIRPVTAFVGVARYHGLALSSLCPCGL